MMNWLIQWIINAVALAIICLLPIGVNYDKDKYGALILVAILMGLVNSFVKPILSLLTLPLNCLTFGLFGFLVNTGLFYLVGNSVQGFHVKNFTSAIIGSVLMGILCGVLNTFLTDKKK